MREGMERDPVCGMNVEVAKAAATMEHRGKTYYFCAKSCAARFREDPQKHLQGKPSGPSASAMVNHIAPAASHPGAVAAPKARAREHQARSADAVGDYLDALQPQPSNTAAPASHPHHHEESSTGMDARHREAAGGVRYTCPMHPEVVQIGPGGCPICGMALEPLDPL